jgi:hypothetical protein
VSLRERHGGGERTKSDRREEEEGSQQMTKGPRKTNQLLVGRLRR